MADKDKILEVLNVLEKTAYQFGMLGFDKDYNLAKDAHEAINAIIKNSQNNA